MLTVPHSNLLFGDDQYQTTIHIEMVLMNSHHMAAELSALDLKIEENTIVKVRLYNVVKRRD